MLVRPLGPVRVAAPALVVVVPAAFAQSLVLALVQLLLAAVPLVLALVPLVQVVVANVVALQPKVPASSNEKHSYCYGNQISFSRLGP